MISSRWRRTLRDRKSIWRHKTWLDANQRFSAYIQLSVSANDVNSCIIIVEVYESQSLVFFKCCINVVSCRAELYMLLVSLPRYQMALQQQQIYTLKHPFIAHRCAHMMFADFCCCCCSWTTISTTVIFFLKVFPCLFLFDIVWFPVWSHVAPTTSNLCLTSSSLAIMRLFYMESKQRDRDPPPFLERGAFDALSPFYFSVIYGKRTLTFPHYFFLVADSRTL